MESLLIKQAEELFDEIINEVIKRLRSDESYMALVRKRTEIQLQYSFVMSVVEGDESIFPSAEEYLAWLEVKQTFDETELMERLAIYCQGHADCYAYLKKIGAF
ncbi:hypothetical protein SAMN05880570_4003 [Paenibacillus sp. RU4T]|uniref:DUF6664 family protein n=1 Tax=unclassified Paenibacillus TaxID=185978 RepID=UPI0009551393|nr:MULTISPECIES: hypothetical protein [unclassified Paenibacillus]SIR49989.1 hypothetical protein SAMN05880555_4000 [Paenibacillus sp. RU4X]SIR59018.1 hypothetical protein SAMN05880570_4003 [Paenibacillus sp. RU4T]